MSNIIWDSLFVQGNIIIFKAVIALFNLLKNEIMGKTAIEEINNLFEESTIYLNDYNFINYYLILKKFEFNFKIISFSRSELEDKIIENIYNTNKFNIERNKKNKEEKKRSSFLQSVTDCNKEWPICIYDNDYKYRIVSYFYYMIYPGNINIIQDYFYKEINHFTNNFNNKEKSNDNSIDLCIGMSKSRKKSNNSYNTLIISESENNKFYNAIDSFEKDKDSISTHSENCQFKEIDNEMDIYKELRIERRLHFCDKLFNDFNLNLNICNNSEKDKEKDKEKENINNEYLFSNINIDKVENNLNNNSDELDILNINREYDSNVTNKESKN